jgi:hypothetical protein
MMDATPLVDICSRFVSSSISREIRVKSCMEGRIIEFGDSSCLFGIVLGDICKVEIVLFPFSKLRPIPWESGLRAGKGEGI